MSAEQPAPRPYGAYEAAPGEVDRVLLLYSGGLDTSVMLKWIQDQYGAEVIALCVNLGQPDEDFDVVRGKALDLGALHCEVLDAREEFARDYVAPAIRANARYGGGYPLFTALGRPLIAKLAVEQAREHGCDAVAHGCTGKGNDQVRIDATVLALAPDMKIVAPVRNWSMGREEEIAYAREHGIPLKGGSETTLVRLVEQPAQTHDLRPPSVSPRWAGYSASRRTAGRAVGCRTPWRVILVK